MGGNLAVISCLDVSRAIPTEQELGGTLQGLLTLAKPVSMGFTGRDDLPSFSKLTAQLVCKLENAGETIEALPSPRPLLKNFPLPG